MEIRDVIILPRVLAKMEAKHNVKGYEVREIFDNRPHFRYIERGKVVGEDLYAVLGQTNAGRYLKAFFVYKRNKDALVITAFDMNRKERRQYART
ncbi:BrnT family toxin [bacterium]|nr:BrnT family toxin [bacterium]